MHIVIILVLSVIGHSFGDILQVKCGDETCEKPSNRAVTTLRYTPDKPYKLQINAVNAEVEIYGATDDLYYIRHGRNYGFLPKNHVREKARGNFNHQVEIDISTFKINQEVRETNFLHTFLITSQTGESHTSKNDNIINIVDVEMINNQKNVTEETRTSEVKEERHSEYIPIGIEPNISQDYAEPSASSSASNDNSISHNDTISNEDNDSGIEETDEMSEDESEEDDEDDLDGVFDKDKEETTQENEIKVAEELPNIKIIDVKPASLDISHQDDLSHITTESTEQLIENIEKIEVDDMVKEENLQMNQIESKEENEEIIPQQVEILSEPISNVTNNEEENLEKNSLNSEEKLDIPVDTTELPIADILPSPQVEVTTESIILEISSTTEQSEDYAFNESTESSVPVTLSSEEQEPSPLQLVEHQPKQTEDILLKRFDEKLTQKVGHDDDDDGVGSIEEVHSNHDHHSHSHFSHGHQHDEKNVENEKIDEIKNIDNDVPTTDNENNQKTGFMGNLFKKIFGETNENAIINEKVSSSTSDSEASDGFCEKEDDLVNCPKNKKYYGSSENNEIQHNIKIESYKKTFEQYINIMMEEAVSKIDLIISLALTALTSLIFILGYYCINRARKEGPLIARMNELERHLMAAGKENETLKADVINTKQKLVSIEDNSFGSNDMVIALKRELEENEKIKMEMVEKISSLEKELEAAAEDGLELNRMVSELLSNQSGSESIISSVEELQRQLNEQQETIVQMNETLAAKSRENTELQIQLSEINRNFQNDMEHLQQEKDSFNLERSNLQLELENIKRESDIQVNQLIEERNKEVTRLNSELTSYAGKYDDTRKKFNAAESKVQALEECIETLRKSKGGDFKNILDVADLKADLLAVTKEKSTQQEQLQTERDAKKLLEDRVKSVSEELSNLKKDFGSAEKEKLEALTRLDVLSAYFKETETRLQLELSEEKARWMKQQGETMSTVEKVQALNDEIQTLKSQNDSLRAEIEAQVAAHKLNISSIEAQSHSAWLNARQAERKLEDSRMEAAALRRRLTSIAENPSGGGSNDLLNGLPVNDSMNSISSPQRVESPNMAAMPPMNAMPPMPAGVPFLPGAPFLPPFMLPNPGQGLPGLPPLGRLMSPPPKRFTPTDRDRRYSPRSRDRYSPESRYDDDYTAFETETDYSPPPSPSPRRGYSSPSDRNKKGGHNSSAGSVDSSSKPSRRK